MSAPAIIAVISVVMEISMPVWTAFVTHQIFSPTWMILASPNKVHLMDLQKFIFTDDYSYNKAPDGEHELHFVESNGKILIRLILPSR